MRFSGISIITDNYAEMVNFYKKLLQVDVKDEGVIAVFKIKGGKFSICNTSVMRFMAPDCMKGAGNGSYTIWHQAATIGSLLYLIGNSFGFPIKYKALRSGSHCGGEELCR